MGRNVCRYRITSRYDVSEVRNLLLEAVAESDENLMDKYFTGEEFTQDEIVKGLHNNYL